MIPQIEEINFPEYATLSQATVTLNDMGDKTISAQIKIDGDITPNFSFNWEVEFQGETYIHPLREPQASKGNESICSTIDLTFYHKTIYDLKRYFFVEMSSTESGTAIADKYIADLNVNLEQFKVALQDVLDYYHKIGYLDEPITVKLYGENTGIYAKEAQYVQIQYTHIWDVIQKIYDLFGVRWSIEGREIRIGYPTEDISHTFEYGFEGGLLKVERQVQSADIRNSLLGRGGEQNLPYRYFKDIDPKNPTFQADPDWIPELANIYFAELRGKTFRDYVKGWKAKHYGGASMSVPTEAYTKGYTDTTFNPIEYVEDKESIAKYGLLQGGLPNNEEIRPTIQGVEVEGLGRIDQIVGAEQVVVDENTEKTTISQQTMSVRMGTTETNFTYEEGKVKNFVTMPYRVPQGYAGSFIKSPNIKATIRFSYDVVEVHRKYGQEVKRVSSKTTELWDISSKVLYAKIYDVDSKNQIKATYIPDDIKFEVRGEVELSGFPKEKQTSETLYQGYVVSKTFTPRKEGTLTIDFEWELDYTPVHGLILGNYIEGNIRKSAQISNLVSGAEDSVELISDKFEVSESGATNVDALVNIIVDETGEGLYEWKRVVEAVNIDTNEAVSSINIPKGRYYLRIKVYVKNISTKKQTYKVELLPTYIYFPYDAKEWQPTFDIWVKNIWGTIQNEGESNEAYAERVWRPILGDRQGDEAKVCFATGNLAGHSDWEFTIEDFAYAGGDGVELDGVKAEWRLTLAKSDAEIEATNKWIPSTMQQANAGDYFYLIGIDMPHQYVVWAEERLDDYKRDQLLNTANIKPTWVVQTDKVRLNQQRDEDRDTLLNLLKIGNSIHLADTRFIVGTQSLYLQSVTYTWQQDTVLLPEVEIVLSDKITTVSNPISQLQGEVDTLTKQVGSISNIKQVVTAVGDKLYLRKDGREDRSNSPTKFAKSISSTNFEQGSIAGRGWGLRVENGKAIIEADMIIARNDLQVNNFIANQISVIGGKEILSAASMTCSRVETSEKGFVCYFDQKQGAKDNLFVVGDIGYSQVFDSTNNDVKYYKREVVATTENSITLSLDSLGDGMPQEGDVIAQYGNTTDTNRQYVIIRDVIGGGYECMLSDLNSVSASGTEYYFAGRMGIDTPRWFVGDKAHQYIEYKDGHLQIVANITLGEDSDLSKSNEFKELTTQVQNQSDELDKFGTDLEAVKAQSDKEYTIWFFDAVPTNFNEPAVNWTTGEEKAKHDQDMYYSDTLGRAWRWELSSLGTYSWNEITDAYTIEALAKAQQALDKASSVEQKVSDLEFLKYAFPNAVLDSEGVILSKLMAVKDGSGEDANVVAGIYGGDSEMLNENGYQDATHGTLMMFAGAPSVGEVSESDFKVYKDGYMEARTGAFSGLIYNKTIVIDTNNFFDYFESTGETNNYKFKSSASIAGCNLVINDVQADNAFGNVTLHIYLVEGALGVSSDVKRQYLGANFSIALRALRVNATICAYGFCLGQALTSGQVGHYTFALNDDSDVEEFTFDTKIKTLAE